MSSFKDGWTIKPTAFQAIYSTASVSLNICARFYYLYPILDGCSRYIVHWQICESMTEAEIEIVIHRTLEMFPGVRPRIISDNGTRFIGKDFQ